MRRGLGLWEKSYKEIFEALMGSRSYTSVEIKGCRFKDDKRY